MEFLDLLQKRRSCHHFRKGVTIPDDTLKEMINRTRLTPSGYNAQPWEFIVIRDPKNIETVGNIAFKQPHVKDASALILVLADLNIGRNVDSLLDDWVRLGYCTDEDRFVYRNSIAKNRSHEKRKQMALRNTMLACMTLMYVVQDMGYASCPIMGLSQRELEAELNIPEDRVIGLLIALGEEDPGKEKERLPRKALDDLIHWESFEA